MNPRSYDEAEERFIILHHNQMTIKELAAAVNLPYLTVYGILSRLCIKAKCGKRVRKVHKVEVNPNRVRVMVPDRPKEQAKRPPSNYSNTGGYLAVQRKYL
jgi:hypothetical protein